jgi:pilus assembly protein CpaF
LQDGSDLTIIATGETIYHAKQAGIELARQGVSTRVLDMAWIKPCDKEAILKAARDTKRIITVEDSAELKLTHENLCRLEARPANVEGQGRITIRDLVINTLRMRPDRIIVGECRGPEALDMLQAMNTGHDGSMTTCHANTPRDALSRLENMVMMAGFELPSAAIREQIASAIHLIVQQTRLPDGSRKIVKISEVTGRENGIILMQDIFTFEQEGFDEKFHVLGHHTATGNIPRFIDELRQSGDLQLDMSVFVPEN